MQATQPVRIVNAGRAALAAIVLAATIFIAAVVASGVLPSLGAGTDAGAGANQAPLVLDPDSREGRGWKQPGAHRPQ